MESTPTTVPSTKPASKSGNPSTTPTQKMLALSAAQPIVANPETANNPNAKIVIPAKPFELNTSYANPHHTNYYNNLFHQCDKKLLSCIEYNSKLINHRIMRVNARLDKLEDAIAVYINETSKKQEKELGLAETLVNKELRSKVLMAQWTNYFLAHRYGLCVCMCMCVRVCIGVCANVCVYSYSDQVTLDPITFTFARYSLNVCICYGEVTADYFIKANVHKQLVAFGGFDSELVVGPAVMALAHLALFHAELRAHIVLADALPMALKLLVYSNSRPILINTCKMCASLALHFPNKSAIVNSGCLHTLLDLILGTHKDFVDNTVQYYSLCSVVNIVYGSDANRVLLCELNGAKPILECLQLTSLDPTILQCMRAVANIVFTNPFAASKVLALGGDVIIVEILETTDFVQRQVDIVYAGFSALANICSSEQTQTRVGSLPGLVDIVLRVCDNARYGMSWCMRG
jgi:hypothetical protein